jgi:putative sterol carrier protein
MGKIDKPSDWFDTVLPAKVKENPKLTGGFEGAFAFKITGEGGGEWTAVLKGQDLAVQPGIADDAVFSIAVNADDFVKMMNGELNGQAAFMSGKLRFKGNMGQAMKLQGLLF